MRRRLVERLNDDDPPGILDAADVDHEIGTTARFTGDLMLRRWWCRRRGHDWVRLDEVATVMTRRSTAWRWRHQCRRCGLSTPER